MSSSVLHLIDAPFKDFVLVANDGKEIPVHKCVLYGQSDVFNNLFTDIGMQIVDRFETDCDYDTLLYIVLWMYGVKYKRFGTMPTLNVEFVHKDLKLTTKYSKIYDIADKLQITKLLDWKLYITINDQYVSRVIDIETGKKDRLRVEELNYEEIYKCVITHIALNVITSYKTDIKFVRSMPPRMIVDWIKNKQRVLKEFCLVEMSNDKFLHDIILPHINTTYISVNFSYHEAYELGYNNKIDKWLKKHNLSIPQSPDPPTTYAQMRYLRTIPPGTIAHISKICMMSDVVMCYKWDEMQNMKWYTCLAKIPRLTSELITEDDYNYMKNSAI